MGDATGAPAAGATTGADARPTRWEWLALAGIVALASLLRFADLPTRGAWDADQGHDMLVLRALVRFGTLPLVGPPTSIGDFHHGALYYYLLAPAAALGGGNDPRSVVGAIALAGTAAVAVTWWLARSIGGAGAGLLAALLLAVSASAIDESTFIWNPNLIALTSAVALACAYRAWTTGRARWWVGAAAGAIATMHCHVLGVALVPALGAFLLADARRRTGAERRRVLAAGTAGLGLVALSYVPLLAYELGHDFTETRAAVAFLRSGGPPAALGPATRLVFVALRIVSWPLTGLVTDAWPAALAAFALVGALLVWRLRAAARRERTALAWLGLTLGWGIVFLAVGASSLTTVVPGLPVDHYHAFLDPLVVVIAAVGLAALWRGGARGRIATGALVLAFVGWNVTRLPPAVAPDGGFPAADAAAARIVDALGPAGPAEPRPVGQIRLVSLPRFKTPEAIEYPLVRRGLSVTDVTQAPVDPSTPVVVMCDALFRDAIGAGCGGAAETARLGVAAAGLRLVDRFEAAPGRWISVYRPAP